MGRITTIPSQEFKGHVGTPASPTDFNSIEAAVRGTLNNPPASINDFDSLVALANWQLLDEVATAANGTPILRGQQPTSYGHFQGFPRATVIFEIQFFEYDLGGGALDLLVRLNNRVGYPITLTVRARMTNIINSNTQREVTRTFPAGETQLLFTFEWNSEGWGSSEPYFITLLNSDQSVYEPANLTGIKERQSGGNFVEYLVQLSSLGYSCHTPSGPSLVSRWFGPLSVGTTVQNNSGLPLSNGDYIASNGSFIFTILSGQVSRIDFCSQE